MSAFYAGFRSDTHSPRVKYEQGSHLHLADEMAHLGCDSALVLCVTEQAELGQKVADSLGKGCAGLFTKAAMHTPVVVTQEAMDFLSTTKADCLIAVGGGSAIGLGKAIALRTDLPQIVLPTTFSGSEATPILGQTEEGTKTTLTSPKVLPETVVYDATLVKTLPKQLAVASGLNAIAHAVEALYSEQANKLSTAIAFTGIRSLVNGLPGLIEDANDLSSWEEALFGSWCCGSLLGQVGMALHHKLCHTLGGTLDLPHAQTHAIILPHATKYNEGSATVPMKQLAELLGAGSASQGLWDFATTLDAPMTLRELGVEENQLDQIAKLASAKPYPNPTPIDELGIRALLQAAFTGTRP